MKKLPVAEILKKTTFSWLWGVRQKWTMHDYVSIADADSRLLEKPHRPIWLKLSGNLYHPIGCVVEVNKFEPGKHSLARIIVDYVLLNHPGGAHGRQGIEYIVCDDDAYEHIILCPPAAYVGKFEEYCIKFLDEKRD